MSKLVFRTLHGEWYADGAGPFVGEVTLDDPSDTYVRLAAHAHAAGVIEVTKGLDLSTVQSQEDGEAALAEAMGEHVVEQNEDGTRTSYWTGPWAEANTAQASADAAAHTANIVIDTDPEE